MKIAAIWKIKEKASGGVRVSGFRGHKSFWRPFPSFPVKIGALEVGHLKPSYGSGEGL